MLAGMPTLISSVGAALTGVVLTFGMALWAWAPQRADVPDPAPSADPQQVVQTYLDAVSARDFATANALVLAPSLRHGRLDPAPSYHDVLVEDPAPAERQGTPFADAVTVPVTASTGVNEPHRQWSVSLVRTDAQAPWRISAFTGG